MLDMFISNSRLFVSLWRWEDRIYYKSQMEYRGFTAVDYSTNIVKVWMLENLYDEVIRMK